MRLLAQNDDKPIGIQLHTLRNLIEQDFKNTLKKLAKIGYKTTEAAGYNNGSFYGYPPGVYKKIHEDTGLVPLSSQSAINLENAGKSIDDALKAGMKCIVFPYLSQEKRRTIDDYKMLSNELNLIGRLCKSAGLEFCYHNHDFEFHKIKKQLPYDVLMQETDPLFVNMELDIYWMVFAGQDPLVYFDKYPGRFKLWHVKDLADAPDKKTTEIGSGVIDFPALFAQADKAGLENFFVEQESFDIDPIKSVAQSFQYLNSL